MAGFNHTPAETNHFTADPTGIIYWSEADIGPVLFAGSQYLGDNEV